MDTRHFVFYFLATQAVQAQPSSGDLNFQVASLKPSPPTYFTTFKGVPMGLPPTKGDENSRGNRSLTVAAR